jgi:elongation factor P
MYDTSDIRKGLKVLMDGNPYTVVEFQFVKPGKGAAFTRTKFKNLLTGAVVERNIRSGEKLEPANVDQRDMQFLYKEGEDLVFMDQKLRRSRSAPNGRQGGRPHEDNLPCTVLFFNSAPSMCAPDVRVPRGRPRARRARRHQRQRPEARHRRDRRRGEVPLFIRVGGTIGRRVRTSTSSARKQWRGRGRVLAVDAARGVRGRGEYVQANRAGGEAIWSTARVVRAYRGRLPEPESTESRACRGRASRCCTREGVPRSAFFAARFNGVGLRCSYRARA